ncbi:MAG: glycosyl hydrolase family 28 protein [Eubacteriales bacterium]
MIIYPFPEHYEKKSNVFSVNCDGKTIGVYACDVSAVPLNQVWPGYQRPFDQTEPTSYVSLGSDGTFTLNITPAAPFETVTVRPLSRSITPQINAGTVSVTFPGPSQYSVEFDGMHHVLTVFANPEKDFGITPEDENVLYFAPGVHFLEEVVELDDNCTVYLAHGSVVYGGFKAAEKHNIRVIGYGILDNSNIERGKGTPFLFSHCENVLVEGVTVVNSAAWSIHFSGCTDVTVENIKLIGMWRYNSDGCDFTNCTHAVLRNSYLRNYDDCVVIKGLSGNRELPVSDIRVEHCVLWCDWGRALEIGAETSAPSISGVRFTDCDIIHGDAVMMDIQHGDRALISDILFQNIRAEYMAKANAGKLQTAPGEVYVNPDENFMPSLFILVTLRTIYSRDDITGNISGVHFKDISVTTEDGRVPPSCIAATAPDTLIENIVFENIIINGKACKTLDALNLTVSGAEDAVLPPSSITSGDDKPQKGGTVRDIVLR